MIAFIADELYFLIWRDNGENYSALADQGAVICSVQGKISH